MSYQIIIIEGNLGSDPETRQTPNGKTVCSFSVAVNEGSGENQHTEWFKCVAWEKTAELAAGSLRKGHRVLLQGHLRTSTWKDQQGQDRQKTELYIDRLTFLMPKDQGQGQPQHQGQYQAPAPPPPQAPPQYRQAPPSQQPPAARTGYQPAPPRNGWGQPRRPAEDDIPY